MNTTDNKKIAICLLDENDNVVSMKKLTVKWERGIKWTLESLHNIDIRDEIAYVMYTEIMNNLEEKDIRELLE